jgi:hypothetical protein
MILGFERGFALASHSTTWATPPSPFLLVFFFFFNGDGRGWELFTWAGLWLSASQTTRITDVNHWHPSSILFIYLFCGTGAWTEGLLLEPVHQPFFFFLKWKVFFEIGSHKLFGWAGFEL